MGLIQIESGWVYTLNNNTGAGQQISRFPSSLVRIGVLANVELRLAVDGGYWEKTDGVKRRGSGDVGVGTKIHLRDEVNRKPETALLAFISIPTHDRKLLGEELDAAFRLTFSYTFSDRLSSGFNTGVSWSAQKEENTLAEFNYTAALGINLVSGVGMFVEIFGDIPLNSSGTGFHSLDGGFTVIIRENLQWDFSGGISLTEQAGEGFIGLGFSWRLPR